MTHTADAAGPPADIDTLVAALAELMPARGQRLVTAESCTGGLIAAACTERAGSSAWFERGYVTYSNAAKHEDLRVGPHLIAAHGAVSAPVVGAMTRGALTLSGAEWAIAVSGVAGPGGGSPDKPVGTVYIGWQQAGASAEVTHHVFDGDRASVRRQTVVCALAGLKQRIERL
ncbi:CinA family protein [uncultured Salinisphaera sp.]|uniref:CinA family protein n=1 Tax=uncultured Salinisphaera sp. TaxID=359372 RepID=UPI0032B0F1F9|tara:strand:- start:6911 stop:7429 length:519 start_codon:yes stop_codon:yes gene_type:complete